MFGGRCYTALRRSKGQSTTSPAPPPADRHAVWGAVSWRPANARCVRHVTSRMTTISRSIWRARQAEHTDVSKRAAHVAKALGKRIRQLRTAKGWSQEFLANQAEMHRTYMWGVEQGLRNPSIRHLTQIADALEVPLATLFDGL